MRFSSGRSASRPGCPPCRRAAATFVHCAVLMLLLLATMTSASRSHTLFVAVSSTASTRHTRRASASQASSTTTRLFMSDLPSNNKNNKKNNGTPRMPASFWRGRLPPGPEDQLTLTGDILALFVYSFMDHIMNDWYVNMVTNNDPNSAMLDPARELTTATLPVWWDSAHLSTALTSEHLMTLLGLHGSSYAPAISTGGLAFVVLSSCWLLAGYIHQAFSFHNTLQCDTSRALWITGRTWITTCVLVCLLSVASHGIIDGGSGSTTYGLSKADADYIFDSLTVLVTWRYLVSWMLGTGK